MCFVIYMEATDGTKTSFDENDALEIFHEGLTLCLFGILNFLTI